MRRPLSWSSWGLSALVLEETCLTLISQVGMLSPPRGRDLSRVTQRVSGRLTLLALTPPRHCPLGLRQGEGATSAFSLFSHQGHLPILGPLLSTHTHTHTHTHTSLREIGKL